MKDWEAAEKIKGFTKSVEAKIKQKGRAQGRLDAEVDNLKRAGFDSIEAAQEFVATGTEELQTDFDEFVKDVGDFENEYPQFLS